MRLVVFSILPPLLLMLKLDLASGQQMCNSYDFYCVDSTSFMVCVDNFPPSGPTNDCPMGTYCCMDRVFPCDQNETCPITTTQIPTTTTELPSTTTELPSTTTELPSTTTQLPSTTTQLPSTTTELPSTTTTEMTTITTTTTEKPFTCQTSGRFPDPNNCTNYYMCSPMSNGSFYEYLYPCPGGSVFNPATSKCTIDSTGNICRTTSSSTSTSTTSTTTPTPPSSSSTTSSSTSTTTTTPPTPPSSSTTSTTTTTPPTPPSSSSTSTSTTTAAPKFTCVSSGRFPYPEDRTKYYLCSPNGNGGYYEYLYTCPSGSVFDPATAKCKVSSV